MQCRSFASICVVLLPSTVQQEGPERSRRVQTMTGTRGHSFLCSSLQFSVLSHTLVLEIEINKSQSFVCLIPCASYVLSTPPLPLHLLSFSNFSDTSICPPHTHTHTLFTEDQDLAREPNTTSAPAMILGNGSAIVENPASNQTLQFLGLCDPSAPLTPRITCFALPSPGIGPLGVAVSVRTDFCTGLFGALAVLCCV